jgi:transposase
MCLLPRRSTATIRPLRCWSPVSAEPELGDYGRMSATTGRSVAPHRRRQSTFTAPTAAASIQRPISRTSRAFYKPMPIAGSGSGFGALYQPRQAGPGLPTIPAITQVACWSHCRRKIFDVWETTKSTVAKAALDQIAQFYAIEDKARFAAPAERLQHRAAVTPLLDAFFVWAQNAERKLSARSELAEALRYIIRRRTALTRFATDARLEADNNIAENAIRGIALGRRNWLFAGSHSGGERAAAMYSILQTAKLNGVNPQAYLTDTLSQIAARHPINRISELIPWAYQSATSDTAA